MQDGDGLTKMAGSKSRLKIPSQRWHPPREILLWREVVAEHLAACGFQHAARSVEVIIDLQYCQSCEHNPSLLLITLKLRGPSALNGVCIHNHGPTHGFGSVYMESQVTPGTCHGIIIMQCNGHFRSPFGIEPACRCLLESCMHLSFRRGKVNRSRRAWQLDCRLPVGTNSSSVLLWFQPLAIRHRWIRLWSSSCSSSCSSAVSMGSSARWLVEVATEDEPWTTFVNAGSMNKHWITPVCSTTRPIARNTLSNLCPRSLKTSFPSCTADSFLSTCRMPVEPYSSSSSRELASLWTSLPFGWTVDQAAARWKASCKRMVSYSGLGVNLIRL